VTEWKFVAGSILQISILGLLGMTYSLGPGRPVAVKQGQPLKELEHKQAKCEHYEQPFMQSQPWCQVKT